MPLNPDPAKVMVPDNRLKFARPWITAGGLKFTWPVGVEGFRLYGNATLAVHHYIGGNTPDVNVIHFHEGHIEMSGTLAGLTSPANYSKLQDIITAKNRKTLALPGILAKVQYVVVENYDFSHDADDRTASMPYSINMIRVGNTGSSPGGSAGGSGGKSFEVFEGASEAVNGPNNAPSRGSTSESDRTFNVVQGVDTFQSIADHVYGDVDKWPALIDLNREALENNNPSLAVNTYQLPFYRWPMGTKIAY